jgi:hypothetical protein
MVIQMRKKMRLKSREMASVETLLPQVRAGFCLLSPVS